MGGQAKDAIALEVGCGNGYGIDIILDTFKARHVDAFDLDSRMVDRAKSRWHNGPMWGDALSVVTLWQGSVTDIPVLEHHYDAVFDFGLLHHVPTWRDGLKEISRVLKPGGRLYAEEILRKFSDEWPWKHMFDHPEEARFSHTEFGDALAAAGFNIVASKVTLNRFAWFVADKT